MGEILDDMDSRPGSATSLLRTVVGLYLRELGGWIAVPHLLELLDVVGVPAPRARTALARVKKKGLLAPETRGQVAGYALVPDAVAMLRRGDRRIRHPRTMGEGDPWCLVSFSIPEAQRDLRHQLRRRLHWIGCGTVSPALWICPGFLVDEVEEILAELGVRQHATVFLTERPRVGGELRAAVAGWWDLEALRRLHDAFLAEHAGAAVAGGGAAADPAAAGAAAASRAAASGGDAAAADAAAFAAYVRAIDTWRIIPYLDPGLPSELLPPDWPGAASAELMASLRARFAAPAARFAAGPAPRIRSPW